MFNEIIDFKIFMGETNNLPRSAAKVSKTWAQLLASLAYRINIKIYGPIYYMAIKILDRIDPASCRAPAADPGHILC